MKLLQDRLQSSSHHIKDDDGTPLTPLMPQRIHVDDDDRSTNNTEGIQTTRSLIFNEFTTQPAGS